MYAHFYHLSENPFNLTPDPKFHYINESTREALASILYGIKSRKGFLTLIGEAGCGKTTLLRRIVDEIEGETRIVFVFNPGVSFDELLEYLCMELGIRAEARGRLHLLEKLNSFLLQQLTEGRNVVVIIDEAQTLEDDVLEELRLLSNLETSKEKILQILLSGQPELEEKLRRPNLRQLRQRISVRATLKPMRSDEIRAYVETRLRGAGSEKAELFTTAALLRCWQASSGIPRVINVICDNAMMVAFAEGKDRISVSVMNAAIRDLDGQTRTEAALRAIRDAASLPFVRYGAMAAAVLVAAFVLGRGLPAMPWAGQVATTPMAPVPDAPVQVAKAAEPSPVRDRKPRDRKERPALTGPASVAAEAPPVVVPPVVAPHAAVASPAPVAPVSVPPAVALPSAPAVPVPPVADPLLYGDPLAEDVPPVPVQPAVDVMTGSVRRAEDLARSTAARMYGVEEPAPTPVPRPASPESVVPDGEETLRPVEDAEAMAAEALRQREAMASLPPPVRGLAPEAPPSVAAAPSGLAGGLESVASLSGGAAKVPKVGGKPVVGRHVRVTRGDSVWAIAMQYYGTVDSAALTEIFRHNPAIKNAHQLPVGSDVFVPFLGPEQMIAPAQGGGYQVLVAESTEAAQIEKASAWASSRLPSSKLRTVSKGKGTPVRMVYATGFQGRESAIDAARKLLGGAGR